MTLAAATTKACDVDDCASDDVDTQRVVDDHDSDQPASTHHPPLLPHEWTVQEL